MKRILTMAALLVAAMGSEALAQQAPPPYPPPPYSRLAPPVYYYPRLYVRADGGGAFSADSRFRDVDTNNPALGEDNRIDGDFGNGVIGDVGIGARFTPWFRVDLTGSGIFGLKFNGTDNNGLGTTNTATVRTIVGLANFYFDFPVNTIFGPLSPYFDFGVGGAATHLGRFNSGFTGGSFAANDQANLAVSVGAGIAYPITDRVSIDLAYKLIDIADVRTGNGTVPAVGGGTVAVAPIHTDLAVHTVTLGVRVGF
ncbi:MAG TPA: outer membrane beta-barrel protein [Stellaceae bacterium]|nr:outer membrane beta-barrel protein [Stellaceae bacterium]